MLYVECWIMVNDNGVSLNVTLINKLICKSVSHGAPPLLLQECKVELESAKPVIREGLDHGRLLLDDDVIDDDKKAEIKKEVDEVEYDLAKMERDNADTQGR